VDKSSRLKVVARVLEDQLVGDQQTLREVLARRGIVVSQSSLSRDLRELGVQRVRTADGVFAYTLPAERPAATSMEVFRRRFSTSVTGVRRTSFVLLVFTPPGEAQLVGRLLDTTTLPGLLGTVAGDDTVICITDTDSSARALENRLSDMIH
jgi:transcriptional regulator of arginine metabolism